MKIRSGFVSNSSSTSFTIAGICIDEDEVEKTFKVKCWEEISDKLSTYHYWDTSNVYVGLIMVGEEEHRQIPSQMGDNETKSEFLKRASDLLSEVIGEPTEAKLISASWYNG